VSGVLLVNAWRDFDITNILQAEMECCAKYAGVFGNGQGLMGHRSNNKINVHLQV
jgi:hypothetical protein